MSKENIPNVNWLTKSYDNLPNVNLTFDDFTRLKGSNPSLINKQQGLFIFEPTGKYFELTYKLYTTLY
jgi:hypothetical protein